MKLFQSTQPEWAATALIRLVPCYINDFNPRSPNGLRLSSPVTLSTLKLFQSTQPEWAATLESLHANYIKSDFNPRSPNGLRPNGFPAFTRAIAISIHAARMGCDWLFFFWRAKWRKFQSTQPEWAATHMLDVAENGLLNFNPRSPNGLRLRTIAKIAGRSYFNPRSPNGLRRIFHYLVLTRRYFNPRSPNGLRLCGPKHRRYCGGYFNPRSPNGLRQVCQSMHGLCK